MITVPFNIMAEDHVAYFKGSGFPLTSDMKGIVAYDKNFKIMGMTSFDHWTESSVFGHIKVTNPMCLKSGGLVDETMRYVFDIAHRENFFGMVPACFENVIKFEKKIGFKELYRIPNGFEVGVDMVIMRKLKSEHLAFKEAA